MKIRFEVPPAAASQSRGLAVRYAEAKRQVPRWRWLLLLVIVLAPVAYFAWRLAQALLWTSAPGVLLLPQSVVKAGVTGVVSSVVDEGVAVARGDVIATIRQAVFEAASAPDSVTPAAPTPPGGNTLARRRAASALNTARAALALAEQQLQWRTAKLDAVQALRAQGAATQAEVDAARAQWLEARADVVRARGDVESATIALEGARAPQAPSPKGVGSARAGPLTFAVRSGADGTVVRVLVARDEVVTADTEIALVHGRDAPVVKAFVPPPEAEGLRAGSRATVYWPDGSRSSAEVTGVEPQAGRLPGDRVSPLTPRGAAVVLTLRVLGQVPVAQLIHELPLDVRFERR